MILYGDGKKSTVQYSKDVHRNKGQTVTVARLCCLRLSPYTTKIARIKRYTMLGTYTMIGTMVCFKYFVLQRLWLLDELSRTPRICPQ